jgi:5-methylthioribose kinase
MFILNANEPEELAAYLQQLKWLDEQETIVSLSKPGEGNMNCVLRVETARSFIVKQSRGYVEVPSSSGPCFARTYRRCFFIKLRWPILYSKSCRSF